VEAETSLPDLRVLRVLLQLADTRGVPEEIHVDHGPEFICRSVGSWCEEHRVLLRYIKPGRPMQNGHIESFNGRLCDECLNANWILNLAKARTQIKPGKPITTKYALTAHLLTNTNEFAALFAQRQPQPTMMRNSYSKWNR
jgi:putative transposase